MPRPSVKNHMINAIDSSRAEMLCEVRAKRESALRLARTGDAAEEVYWLTVAGRMTVWIEQLEAKDGTGDLPRWPKPGVAGIRLPLNAGRSRPLAVPSAQQLPARARNPFSGLSRPSGASPTL